MSKKTGNNKTTGRKNECILPKFIEICKMSQQDLKIYLEDELIKLGYENVVNEDGYLYAKGTIPILLTAHMDTVHHKAIEDYFEFTVNKMHHLRSPQGIGGDDRCGIYMILEIIKEKKFSVLFCEDEEKGGVGSRKFCKSKHLKTLKDIKYMIELDRTNSNDAVFYSCDNPEFTSFICNNTGYKETFGTFSDISVLMPEAKIAGVNLSCGYYRAHTEQEYVVLEEMQGAIEVVKQLADIKCDQFKYVAKSYGFTPYYGNYSGWRRRTIDDYYDNYGANRTKNYKRSYYDDEYSISSLRNRMRSRDRFNRNEYDQMVLIVEYEDPKTLQETTVRITGSTKDELWRNFFVEYSNVCYDMVLDYNYDYL